MRTFLYILQFKRDNLIKIGISKTKNRIRQHNRTYSLDLKRSYIVSCNSEHRIKSLERQLLSDYKDKHQWGDYKGMDGWTELRSAECLDMILEDIQHKSDRFPEAKYSITRGIRISIQKDRIRFPKYEVGISGIENILSFINENKDRIICEPTNSLFEFYLSVKSDDPIKEAAFIHRNGCYEYKMGNVSGFENIVEYSESSKHGYKTKFNVNKLFSYAASHNPESREAVVSLIESAKELSIKKKSYEVRIR